jgi:hypothetical protein
MLAHPMIGVVVIGALFIQPFLGFGHHLLYKARGNPNIFTQPHIWWGRIFVTVGIINGGLGLQLTGGSTAMEFAYTAVSSVVWVAWMAVAFMAWKTKRAAARDGSISGRSDRLGKGRDGSDSEEMVNFRGTAAGAGARPKIGWPQRPMRDDERIPTEGWRDQNQNQNQGRNTRPTRY